MVSVVDCDGVVILLMEDCALLSLLLLFWMGGMEQIILP